MGMMKDKKQTLIDFLSKLPIQVLQIAYLYAANYTRYGVDVTKEWETAIQNSNALERAYKQGQADLLDTLKREIEIKQACKKIFTIPEVVNIIDKYIKLLGVGNKTPGPKELLDDLETKVDTRIRNYGFATSDLDTVFTIKNFIRKAIMELKNDTDRTQSMFNN